jgi:glyoxylase-like metal-dependent hydrolase (beta-lactamase superfamily II)
MRPLGERFVLGRGSLLGAARLVCHVLCIETERAGLVLVDSGLGLDDCARARERLGGPFVAVARPVLDPSETAARQVEALGHRREDVRHIVLTHLDLDHAGGIADFPAAAIHVHRAEHEAAMRPLTGMEGQRYRPAHWAHRPIWRLHDDDGERFEGLRAVRALVEPDVLLVPAFGHTRGHSVVAVRAAGGWLLHCGDAYFHRDEVHAEPPWCPPGLALFQRIAAVDDAARRENRRTLRALARRGDPALRLFSAHDAVELETAARAAT